MSKLKPQTKTKSATKTTQNSTKPRSHSAKAKFIADIILFVFILVLLWIVIPLGFIAVMFADLVAGAMNGSGCSQTPSADHCQPSHIEIYFIAYLIVAAILSVVLINKKMKLGKESK